MDAVQHFEIPYKVRDRAKKFYFQAFGWQMFDVPGASYSFVTTVPIEKTGMPKRAGAINGGLTPRTKELTGPTLLIKVGELKNHLERVRQAGGTVLVEPTAMGPVWYSRFRDTEGNVMGAIQDRPEGQERSALPAKSSRAKPRKTARKSTKVTKATRAPAAKAKPRARKAKRAPREAKATWSR
ncbi:MAG: VOC family protein [Candidatus Thermoplasmatota archaeon]